jgi:2-oxoglutarate dehydrogenase E1 component
MLASRQALRHLPSGQTTAVASAAARLTRNTTTPKRELATAAPAKPPSPNDAFANGTNAYYVEEMYRHWRQDPKSVHVSWDVYFGGMDKGLSSPQAFQPPPSLVAAPVDGAPALYSRGGELDDHLKVKKIILFSSPLFHGLIRVLGSIACKGISSARSSCRRPRPSWYFGS